MTKIAVGVYTDMDTDVRIPQNGKATAKIDQQMHMHTYKRKWCLSMAAWSCVRACVCACVNVCISLAPPAEEWPSCHAHTCAAAAEYPLTLPQAAQFLHRLPHLLSARTRVHVFIHQYPAFFHEMQ